VVDSARGRTLFSRDKFEVAGRFVKFTDTVIEAYLVLHYLNSLTLFQLPSVAARLWWFGRVVRVTSHQRPAGRCRNNHRRRGLLAYKETPVLTRLAQILFILCLVVCGPILLLLLWTHAAVLNMLHWFKKAGQGFLLKTEQAPEFVEFQRTGRYHARNDQ
jgi:hypothetical protein